MNNSLTKEEKQVLVCQDVKWGNTEKQYNFRTNQMNINLIHEEKKNQDFGRQRGNKRISKIMKMSKMMRKIPVLFSCKKVCRSEKLLRRGGGRRRRRARVRRRTWSRDRGGASRFRHSRSTQRWDWGERSCKQASKAIVNSVFFLLSGPIILRNFRNAPLCHLIRKFSNYPFPLKSPN